LREKKDELLDKADAALQPPTSNAPEPAEGDRAMPGAEPPFIAGR